MYAELLLRLGLADLPASGSSLGGVARCGKGDVEHFPPLTHFLFLCVSSYAYETRTASALYLPACSVRSYNPDRSTTKINPVARMKDVPVWSVLRFFVTGVLMRISRGGVGMLLSRWACPPRCSDPTLPRKAGPCHSFCRGPPQAVWCFALREAAAARDEANTWLLSPTESGLYA